MKERNRGVKEVRENEEQDRKVKEAITKAESVGFQINQTNQNGFDITLEVSLNSYKIIWKLSRKEIGRLNVYSKIEGMKEALKKL